MTRNRFEIILSAMMYMSNEPPVYVDRFWEVRQLIDAWNVNMAHNFSPSWINAIDKSMSKWVHVLDLCMSLANSGHLVMNTMMPGVQIVTSFGRLI